MNAHLNAMARALRVLLVGDHDNSRESFKLLLQHWGYSVDTAADGQQGLNLAVNGSYHAVILDLHLPRMDGLDVGHVLSQVIPRPYLFAYTAWSRPQDGPVPKTVCEPKTLGSTPTSQRAPGSRLMS